MLLFWANRDVAQLVSVHVWGACGRQFESDHPDKKMTQSHNDCVSASFFLFCMFVDKSR